MSKSEFAYLTESGYKLAAGVGGDSRSSRLSDHSVALYTLMLTFIGVVAAIVVVPEVRYFLHLENRPHEQLASTQTNAPVPPAAAVANDVKAELSQPLSASLAFLKRVNMKGNPPDAVGHLVVSNLRSFVRIADTDEDIKKLNMLPSTLHEEVLNLAKALESSELIMSNRELSAYSTPQSVAVLNGFEPEIHRVWVHLASLQ